MADKNNQGYVVWNNQTLIVDGSIVTYSVSINPLLLEEQVRKAARNKRGKSWDGALLVEVAKRHPLKGGGE